MFQYKVGMAPYSLSLKEDGNEESKEENHGEGKVTDWRRFISNIYQPTQRLFS